VVCYNPTQICSNLWPLWRSNLPADRLRWAVARPRALPPRRAPLQRFLPLQALLVLSLSRPQQPLVPMPLMGSARLCPLAMRP
jgi:hypothetical protein